MRHAPDKLELSDILITTALVKLNATGHSYQRDLDCNFVVLESCHYPSFNPENFIRWRFRNTIVITGFPGFSFLSCYLVSSGVSFSLYLAPYDATVWIVTIIMLLLSSSLVALASYQQDKKFYLIALFLYFFGCLIDEVSQLPKKLNTSLPLRILSVPWLFVGLLISNCYLSIFITNLNSPLPGIRIDTHDKIPCEQKLLAEVVNFGMIRERFDLRWIAQGDGIANPLLGGICYTILSQFTHSFINIYHILSYKFTHFFFTLNRKNFHNTYNV